MSHSNNDYLTNAYTHTLDSIAERLRTAADDISREGRRTTDHQGRVRHSRAAALVVKEVQTALFNLNLTALLSNAEDADRHWETEPTASRGEEGKP